MWFKRKQKNRRLGREFVLDVKLRSSQVRAARVRMAAIAIGVVFATVFGLYLLWRSGEWALNRFVYENESFAISHIDIQTDGVISTDQLRRWAGVKNHDNLLALDLARVKRDLELVPVIQLASVDRILPRTLRIRVFEREPIAQVNVPRPRAGGGIELVPVQLDADGYAMLPLEARQRSSPAGPGGEQFPIISGINSNDIQLGHRIDNAQLRAALQLILSFEHSAMAKEVELKRIDVSAQEVLMVTTGQGSEVTFGLADLDQQLRRWHDIYDMGQRMSKAIASLDLAIPNHIPARWLEASAVPASTPKPLKTFRTKKKHV
jgi:cell division septal protein FtsQ